MLRTPLLFSCLLLMLMACGPSLDVREETDELGFRREYEVDEAGVRQGYLREYDAEGRLLVEEYYTDGKANGPRVVYNEAGIVVARDSLVMDEYAGESRSYREDGTLEMRGVYTNGAMNGRWYTFHPNGTVKAEITFINNLREGPIRQWYPDGKPELSGQWADGEDFSGPLIRYDSTGQLERVMNCHVKEGCTTYWTPDSTAAMPVPEVDMTRPDGY